MSYDIIVTSAPIPPDDGEAWREIDRVLDRRGPVTPRMDAFYAALAAVYPSGDTLSEDEWETACPWATAPLLREFDADWAHLPIRHPFADRTVPAVIDLAHRHDLAVLDCSAAHQIHRGDGYRGFRLDIEGRPYLIAPRNDQLRDAVAMLSPEGDGAFLLVTAPSGDYAQVAGGLGRYVFERRAYGDGAFRHWAAGRQDHPTAGTSRVRTRGAHIEVQVGEVLSEGDVCELLIDFARERERSPDFAWRDMTGMFLES